VPDFNLPGRGNDPRWASTRASNEERDEVITQLQDHFVEGRLGHDELSSRIDQVWASQTRGELQRVLHDLPTSAGPPDQPVSVPRAQGQSKHGGLGGLRERTGLATWQIVVLAIVAIIVLPIAFRILRALLPILIVGLIIWLIMRNRTSKT